MEPGKIVGQAIGALRSCARLLMDGHWREALNVRAPDSILRWAAQIATMADRLRECFPDDPEIDPIADRFEADMVREALREAGDLQMLWRTIFRTQSALNRVMGLDLSPAQFLLLSEAAELLIEGSIAITEGIESAAGRKRVGDSNYPVPELIDLTRQIAHLNERLAYLPDMLDGVSARLEALPASVERLGEQIERAHREAEKRYVSYDNMMREKKAPEARPASELPPPTASPARTHSAARAAESLEPVERPKVAHSDYGVWYGTNRRPIDPKDASRGYSSQRDTEVHYGLCRVFIPESHKIGSIGSTWWKRLFSRKDDRLKLRSVDELAVADFWGRMSLSLRKSGERTGIIFIHGYNVSFEEAALRAAQLGFDLGIKGAMAFFSWPSRGSLAGYLPDGQSIEASESDIAEFLVDFAERSGASRIHVIAHSMGNRGALGAVNRIAAMAEGRTGVRFEQFILAAADVDADVFRKDCEPYRQLGKRTTLYISARDLAVEAASWLHDFPRVGFLPPVVVLPGMDTVAVTNVDLTLLGHGYVAEARDVLTDIHCLINRDQPPERRFGLREAVTPGGEKYWEIGA